MDDEAASGKAGADKDPRAFSIILIGLTLTIAAAFVLGLILKTPPLARFSFDFGDFIAGLAATAPLVLLLFWFMRTKNRALAFFRESQIEFLAQIGFRFTPARIAIMAIGAGVSEELLFRGVLQTWAAGFLPLAAAIVLTNILFGALHARTVLYAMIAAFVGAYLGVVFEATENLLTAMVTHAAYDAVALELARREIAKRQTRMAE